MNTEGTDIKSRTAFSKVCFLLGFLGTFGKLRKATISLVVSVRPHGTTRLPLDGFSWNFLSIFPKSVEKNQVLLTSANNNGQFSYLFDNISLNSSYNEEYFGQKLLRKSEHVDMVTQPTNMCKHWWIDHQLNAQFLYSLITSVTLYSSTCFEHRCAHPQEERKLYVYSIWYCHTGKQ